MRMKNPSHDPDENQQTLVEHLAELRDRLIKCLFFIGIGFFLCWTFSEQIFDFMRGPIAPYLKSSTGGLVFTAPMDKFMAHLKVSFLAGIIMTCPFWLYQVWLFIAPGLYQHEKKWSVIFVGFGSLLFLLGCAFVYYLVFPMAFKYLMTFGGGTDIPMITISDYISFFFTTTLVFGAAFELPLVLVFLGMIGIIDAEFLKAKRRFAVVALAVLSAVITPPDAISMVMMLIPLLLLYEISIILVKYTGAAKQEEADLSSLQNQDLNQVD